MTRRITIPVDDDNNNNDDDDVEATNSTAANSATTTTVPSLNNHECGFSTTVEMDPRQSPKRALQEEDKDGTDDDSSTTTSSSASILSKKSQVLLLAAGGSASAISCAINLANTMAGTGMLGLPGAIAGTGFAMGTFLLVVTAAFAANGLRLLAKSAETVGITPAHPSSFYTIANAAIPQYTLLIDFCVALNCFGVATGYFITVGDCMSDAVEYVLMNYSGEQDFLESLFESRQFWILWGFVLVIPISFYRTLDSLKFTSTFSLVLIYFLAIGVVCYAQGILDPCQGMFALDTASMHNSSLAPSSLLLGGDPVSSAAANFSILEDTGMDLVHPEEETGLFPLAENTFFEEEALDDPQDIISAASDDTGGRALFSLASFRRLLEEASEHPMEAIEESMEAIEEVLEDFTEDIEEVLFDDEPVCRGDVNPWTSPKETFSSLVIYVYAFACHPNFFAVLNELANRTQLRIDAVIFSAIGSVLILYIVVALEGYRTYGNAVLGDILLNYPQTALVTMMRMAIAVMIVLSYPLQMDPGRRCITSFVQAIQDRLAKPSREGMQLLSTQDDDDDDTEEEEAHIEMTGGPLIVVLEQGGGDTQKTTSLSIADQAEESEEDAVLFNRITWAFLGLSFVISLFVTDLGTILAVVGATGSTMVSFVLPGIIYIKLHSKWNGVKFLAYLQLYVGCLIIPTALYFIIVPGE